MKKFCIFVLLLLLILSTYYFNFKEDRFFELFNGINNVQFCYVFDNKNDQNLDKMYLNNSTRYINTGGYTFVYFDEYINCDANPEYRQATFCETSQLDSFRKNVDFVVVFKEVVQDILIEYGFCPFLKDFVVVKGVKVNIQIAQTNSCITIGYPLIYGSY